MKNQEYKNDNRAGFIKGILIVLAILLILAWLGFDLERYLDADKFKSALVEVWNFLKFVWTEYIAAGAVWVWDQVIVGFIWEKGILPLVEKIKD